MSVGLDNLKHIVVLMMSSRSFDHMLGGLKKKFPKVNGLTGNESNPDSNGTLVKVEPIAAYRGQLEHDPDHHFPGVDLQIFGGAPAGPGRVANMKGFVKSYASQGTSLERRRAVMNYFSPEKIPVLTTLATEFAVFNGWFSSIPGPTICNQAFAHYGTSFGNVDMNMFQVTDASRHTIPTIYERMRAAGHSAKLYYYDQMSSALGTVNFIKDQSFFGTFADFVRDCKSGDLPEYAFVEPNRSDHPGPGGGQLLATDQHPDHHVLAGDKFIASVYNQIRIIPELWQSTALLIVYDQHGGLYDHVAPPNCTPDGFTAHEAATGVRGLEFRFDRLGVRVPAILVSPYIARGTVVPGTEDPASGRIFEHSCIPATICKHFCGGNSAGTPREQQAETFLDLLGDNLRPDNDCVFFRTSSTERNKSTSPSRQVIATPEGESEQEPDVTVIPVIAGYRSDSSNMEDEDLLGIEGEVIALCSVLAAKDVKPPIAVGLFGDWGSGKTFFMQKMQKQFNYIQSMAQSSEKTAFCPNIVQIWFNAWHYVDANLWASLVSHIFEELAKYISPDTNEPLTRSTLLKTLSTAKELLAEAQLQRDRAVEQRDHIDKELSRLAASRAATEAQLTTLKLSDLSNLLRANADLGKNLSSTLEALGLPRTPGSMLDLESSLKDAYTLSGRLRAALLTFWRLGKSRGQAVVLFLLLAGLPILTYLLKFLWPQMISRMAAFWGELTVIVISAAHFVRKYVTLASPYITDLEKRIQTVKDLTDRQSADKSKERLALEQTLNEIKAKELGASQQFSDAQEKVRQIEDKIKEIDEGRSLSKFILERVQTDDYRKHLGIISSVRKDFESLDKLLPNPATDSPLHRVERIILYIDDLDRCPETKVVEVLQAIHLLLAFQLFVVVVGVDSRWLLRSLRLQADVFRGNGLGHEDADQIEYACWEATPLGYLEKIFQIPFGLRPMSQSGFSRLLDNLTLQQSIAPPRNNEPLVEHLKASQQRPKGDPSERARPKQTTELPARIPSIVQVLDPDPAPLQMQEIERKFMSNFLPLIPSPRGAKRFVNVYRLLRASLNNRELNDFIRQDGAGDYQVVQLLLAIQTGFPEQGMQIISDLLDETPAKPWGVFIKKYASKKQPPRVQRDQQQAGGGMAATLQALRWIEFIAAVQSVVPQAFATKTCGDFAKWGRRVARYSFRSIRVPQLDMPFND
jgi:phospholipase C